MGKRGVSNLVAVVLIILITVFSVSILWIGINMLLDWRDYEFHEGEVVINSKNGDTYWDSDKKAACVQVEGKTEKVDKIEVVFDVKGDSVFGYFYEDETPAMNELKNKCFQLEEIPSSVKIIPIFENDYGTEFEIYNLKTGSISNEDNLERTSELKEDILKESFCGDNICNENEILRDCPSDCLNELEGGFLYSYPQNIERREKIEDNFLFDKANFFWDFYVRDFYKILPKIVDKEEWEDTIFSKYLSIQNVYYCVDDGKIYSTPNSINYIRFRNAMKDAEEDWFLKNKGGKNDDLCNYKPKYCEGLKNTCSETIERNVMDLYNPKVRNFIKEEIINYYFTEDYIDETLHPSFRFKKSNAPYNSISFDNIGAFGLDSDPETRAELYDYFSQLLCELKEDLNKKRHVVAGNFGSSYWRYDQDKTNSEEEFKEIMSCMDLVMDEHALTNYRGNPHKPILEEQWESNINNYETAMKQGATVMIFTRAIDNEENICKDFDKLNREEEIFKFIYSSYLLIKDNSLFEFYTRCNQRNLSKNAGEYQFYYHPYLEFNLGKPLEKRKKKNNIWYRKYERGIVLVNPYNLESEFLLDTDYKDFDDHNVNSYKIKSGEGIILKTL